MRQSSGIHPQGRASLERGQFRSHLVHRTACKCKDSFVAGHHCRDGRAWQGKWQSKGPKGAAIRVVLSHSSWELRGLQREAVGIPGHGGLLVLGVRRQLAHNVRDLFRCSDDRHCLAAGHLFDLTSSDPSHTLRCVPGVGVTKTQLTMGVQAPSVQVTLSGYRSAVSPACRDRNHQVKAFDFVWLVASYRLMAVADLPCRVVPPRHASPSLSTSHSMLIAESNLHHTESREERGKFGNHLKRRKLPQLATKRLPPRVHVTIFGDSQRYSRTSGHKLHRPIPQGRNQSSRRHAFVATVAQGPIVALSAAVQATAVGED
mmetsp:Transcript_57520/g.132592  ORF Transcript_57520/g.132592 Transcript_57520/m.132592 type:complete len:317 (-) Transcript_57520:305-1255(-)